MNYIRQMTTEYGLYLRDESKKTGFADSISFPRNSEEISEIVKYCSERNINITVQGSRTGVGSGAVPFGGHIINLERMKSLKMGLDGESVIAGAGCTLKEINEFIKKNTGNNYFFPPDPTESTASAGGMVSCNSSGARTYCYGAVRNYIKRLKIVFADGIIADIKRGENFAEKRSAELYLYNEEKGGDGVAVIGAEKKPPEKILKFDLPRYHMPQTKNAAGYYICDDMDLIDLFIGSEGTLGIISEVEFKIIRKPKLIWGAISYFRENGWGIDFSENLKKCLKPINENMETMPCSLSHYESQNNIMSIEYFDEGSLNLLKIKGWDISDNFKEAVFTELKAESMKEMLENIRLLEKIVIKAHGNPDDVRIAGTGRFNMFKEMRHATPEAVNEKIAERKKKYPVITKLGSDMSVPSENFRDIINMYKQDLYDSDLEYVMFGHIGDNHLHVNIISRNEEDYVKGKIIFSKWAEVIGKIKGSVSAEHGVGKLKREFLTKMYGEEAVDEMQKLKKVFDSSGILGRDNIFIWNKCEK